MNRQVAVFSAPYRVETVQEPLALPAAGELLVATRLSAISAGTELLAYRGLLPPDLPLDETIAALSESGRYPLRYGYAAVGQVQALGKEVDPDWQYRRVFSFQPHGSHFLARTEALLPIPQEIGDDDAVFLPFMETAVSLVMDGRPLVGERTLVLGQGVVGLLVTALLARFPLALRLSLEPVARRREAAAMLGADRCLDPLARGSQAELDSLLQPDQPMGGADLVFELSGRPEALDSALAWAGFDARVIVGSWYGTRTAALHLGGRFHRRRIRMASSQVSTLAPEHAGRWDKGRRMETALQMIREIRPGRLITHRFGIRSAAQAYDLLDRDPGAALQVVLTYDER